MLYFSFASSTHPEDGRAGQNFVVQQSSDLIGLSGENYFNWSKKK
jgi:hypothetical protein